MTNNELVAILPTSHPDVEVLGAWEGLRNPIHSVDAIIPKGQDNVVILLDVDKHYDEEE